MIKNILLFAFSVLMLVSCGTKSKSTTIKFNVSSMYTAGSLPINGGVMVVGHTLDDSENFKMTLVNGAQDMSLDLKKGRWEFAAIAWPPAATGERHGQGTERVA